MMLSGNLARLLCLFMAPRVNTRQAKWAFFLLSSSLLRRQREVSAAEKKERAVDSPSALMAPRRCSLFDPESRSRCAQGRESAGEESKNSLRPENDGR